MVIFDAKRAGGRRVVRTRRNIRSASPTSDEVLWRLSAAARAVGGVMQPAEMVVVRDGETRA